MVINEKASKLQKFFVLQATFSSLKSIGTVFVYSITSLLIITKSSITLAKYLPFSQLHVAGLHII